ncbi:MAG: hypothetical protein AAF297_12245 [Planctomycetota bacterium]
MAKAAMGSVLVLVLASLAGCQPPLFSERDARSPYDQYDVVRDAYSLPYLRDEFDRKLPNLRGRLLRSQ